MLLVMSKRLSRCRANIPLVSHSKVVREEQRTEQIVRQSVNEYWNDCLEPLLLQNVGAA